MIMESNKVKMLSCGANSHKDTSLFNKIIKSKKMNSLLMGVFLFGLTSVAVPDKANAGKVIGLTAFTDFHKAKSIKKVNNITYYGSDKSAIYNANGGEYPNISENDKNAFGMPHPLTTTDAKAYISNKITDNGIERYIVVNDGVVDKNDRLAIEADTYEIGFKNPHTGLSDTMPVFIKKGQSTEELNFLTNIIAAGLETKAVYDNLIIAEEHSGKPIFTASKDDNKGQGAHCIRPTGLIFLAVQDFSSALDGLAHEVEHMNNNIDVNSGVINSNDLIEFFNPMESVQIDEADARITGFKAVLEYKNLYPEKNIEFSGFAKPLADVYNIYKDYNLSENDMYKILLIAALHIDEGAEFYSNDSKQFSSLANDLIIAGKNPQQTENLFKGINPEDLKNLSFGRLSNDENSIFNNLDLKVRVTNDSGSEVHIYPNKLHIPEQSGVLDLITSKLSQKSV